MSHEINSWILDNRSEINPEITRQIALELKAIKLSQGKCIVCNNDFVSMGVIEGIFKVLEKNKAPDNVKKEFKKLFCPDIR